jgi:hypothetical protein
LKNPSVSTIILPDNALSTPTRRGRLAENRRICGIKHGRQFQGLGDMDLDLVMVAVGVIGFAGTLVWMLAG